MVRIVALMVFIAVSGIAILLYTDHPGRAIQITNYSYYLLVVVALLLHSYEK